VSDAGGTLRSDVAGAVIGVASGLRSTIGMATVVLTGPARSTPGLLGGRRAKVTAATLLAGELVADKLPSAPPRTKPPGLVARLTLGAAAAYLLGAGQPAAARGRAATIGSAGALVGAFGGMSARAFGASVLSPVPAALIEDAVAGGLALFATRLAARPAPGPS
jgi:uncharacterized membrane protein